MPETQWPDRAKRHLQCLQETAYAELASLSGLSSREEAFRAFVCDPLPADLYNKMQQEFEHKFRLRIWINKLQRLLRPSTEPFNMFDRYRDWLSTDRPTPYEHPLLYPVLLQIVASIKDGAARNGLERIIPPLLLFGTLPTGSINACATPVPDSDNCLVLFDFGLFQFTGEMAKVLARLLPVQLKATGLRLDMGKAPVAEYAVDQQPDLIAHFDRVLRKYLVEGNPRRMPALEIGQDNQRLLAGALMDASRSFILGHEMGHVLSGHLSSNTEVRQMIGKLSTKEIVRDWEDEYVADNWGFNYEQLRRQGPEWALVGSSVFFSCYSAVERCLIALIHGLTDVESRGSETHPPAASRRERLRNIVKEDTDPEYVGDCLEWSSYIEALMDALTARVCPGFKQMHEDGVRPFGQWARA